VNTRIHVHLPADFSEAASDAVVGAMGSWKFVVAQTFVVALWIAVNVLAWAEHFDPYPFILLNLAFSTQAAYAAPLILMAANRQARKDRVRDDLEAREVDQLFEINKRQLEILELLHKFSIPERSEG
jgi:uncharacterized membrane protein